MKPNLNQVYNRLRGISIMQSQPHTTHYRIFSGSLQTKYCDNTSFPAIINRMINNGDCGLEIAFTIAKSRNK